MRRILGDFEPKEVFSSLANSLRIGPYRKEFSIDDQVYQVKLGSQRYFLFKRQPYCVSCGLRGKIFLLEQTNPANSPHFNFYGIEDGQLILLTKDHIIPKSKGGPNHMKNYQTLCTICNGIKADQNLPLEEIRNIRNTLLTDKD